MTSWWMAREYAISYGYLPGKAIARAKRLIDAELDKNFGQKTVGLKGSEMEIRRGHKGDLSAINERPRVGMLSKPIKQGVKRLLLTPHEQLELPITEEPTH